eukprot:scaffold145316_cov20-Tisochrysis_lutea.AAC.4
MLATSVQVSAANYEAHKCWLPTIMRRTGQARLAMLASFMQVSAANYEARAFGVRASQTIGEAKRLCPHVLVVPYMFDKYTGISEQVSAGLSLDRAQRPSTRHRGPYVLVVPYMFDMHICASGLQVHRGQDLRVGESRPVIVFVHNTKISEQMLMAVDGGAHSRYAGAATHVHSYDGSIGLCKTASGQIGYTQLCCGCDKKVIQEDRHSNRAASSCTASPSLLKGTFV